MKPEFYIVDFEGSKEYAGTALLDVEIDFDKIERCPLCNRYVSGGYWKRPREVVLTKRNPPDFLYTFDSNTNFLVSQRALDVIQKAELTGITAAQEIEFIRYQRKSKVDVPIPKYYHIELARSKMTIDHEKSVILYGSAYGDAPCPLCRSVPRTYDFIRRLELHTEEYEGYDIFHIYELGKFTFLSKRFVDVCREHGLTNLCAELAATHGKEEADYFFPEDESES